MTVHTSGDVLRGRYRLDEVLGRGGFAITWLAQDLTTGRAVAVKELSIRAVEQWRAVELFEREARVLRHLDHPRIPAYLDFFAPGPRGADGGGGGGGEADEAFVLVQELAPGRSLADLVKSGWRATEAEARDLARQVLETLDYLHAFSPPVVHRDLKPQNLIRDAQGGVMLVDFGAVRDTLATESEVGSVAGTFGYMAPEQFSGRALPASDLYGLGATLVHVLSHRQPAELPQRELRLDFRPVVNASEGFLRFLERLLEPTPERRFASARAALGALLAPEALAGPGGVSPSGDSTRSEAAGRAQGASGFARLAERPYESARVKVRPDGDTLRVEARLGLGGGRGGAFTLVFACVWLAFVGFWTVTAIGMGAPIIFPIFSIPFWLVGLGLLRSSLRSAFGAAKLELSPRGLRLERRLAGLRTSLLEAPLGEIVDLDRGRLGKIELFTRGRHHVLMDLPGEDGTEVMVRLQDQLARLRG